MPNPKAKPIADLETRTDLAPREAHRLLGVGYTTYSQYRTASRPLPDYIKNSIQAMLLLRSSELNAMIKQHVYAKAEL